LSQLNSIFPQTGRPEIDLSRLNLIFSNSRRNTHGVRAFKPGILGFFCDVLEGFTDALGTQYFGTDAINRWARSTLVRMPSLGERGPA